MRTCLQAVAQCSPELASDNEKDYTVYAFDYSEPDTPLVGQGMLSWGLQQGSNSTGPQQQLITGRVTKNLLAIFGNGIKETLEVRLKLTAVMKIARSNPMPPQRVSVEPLPAQRTSTPVSSENTEWNSFHQSHPHSGQPSGSCSNHALIAPAPTRPFYSNYDTRNDMGMRSNQLPQQASENCLTSIEPVARDSHGLTRAQDSNVAPTQKQSTAPEESAIAPPPTKGGKPQSRPASRASSRPPSGRPRGRPRKKPLQAEGSTSGYEDGTDADDRPPPTKKRATMTKAERSNTATFGSAPESLRVVASTSGSLRSFRPTGLSGDGPGGNNLQEVPRAPTPVPEYRHSGLPPTRSIAPSNLRRGSMSGSGPESSYTSSFLDLNRPTSFGQDARSPTDSVGVSPSQTYSDEPSPADIGSSPPVPRSTLYSVQSSPAPSSPILPPMPNTRPLPDSGFMSGMIEQSSSKMPIATVSTDLAAAQSKPKPKPKPRRSRAKKASTKAQNDLIIHTETPGPPELLPQTSIYNPPHLNRKFSEPIRTPTVTDAPSFPTMQNASSETLQQVTIEQPLEKEVAPEEVTTQGDSASLGAASISDFMDDQHIQHLDSLDFVNHSFTDSAKDSLNHKEPQPVPEASDSQMRPPIPPQPQRDAPIEPELPMMPASDPMHSGLTFPPLPETVNSQLRQEPSAEPELPVVSANDPMHSGLTFPPPSEPAHPQTDTTGPVDGFADDLVDVLADGKSNKNFVKRQTIRQKLEEAVVKGEAPQFCRNCGALQTPTWRKIWKQKHRGLPSYHEYSEKPGMVTAISILERDNEGKPTSYEILKKSLGPTDNKSLWIEVILCNPCGIWFSKFKQHRPPDKWEKDEQRLSQTRKKRANGSGLPRSKKARTKSDPQTNLTSEVGLPTDPIGALDGTASPKDSITELPSQALQQGGATNKNLGNGRGSSYLEANRQGSTHSRASTHSRGSGTPGSPIAVDEDLGGTRRLLFPSPRKDGQHKILGEVAVNVVHTSSEFHNVKEGKRGMDKENGGPVTQMENSFDNEYVDIFGTPPRPSTPPPQANSGGPFKTPTHPTPSHRPVTRSVTRSLRPAGSPSQFPMPEHTPTRTPRSSAAKRHTPGDFLPSHLLDNQILETPMTRSIHQLLNEADNFMISSPPRDFELDLSTFQSLTNEELAADDPFIFDNLLGTDPALPSSPPVLRNGKKKGMRLGPSLTFSNEPVNYWAEGNGSENKGADGNDFH